MKIISIFMGSKVRAELKPYKADNKTSVVVSNSLIEGRYESMLPRHRRLFYLAIGQIKKSDTIFHRYEVPVSDLVPVGRNTTTSIYSELKKDTTILSQTTVGIETLSNNGKRKYTSFPIFQTVEYEDGSAVLSFELNKSLSVYLLDLANKFTMLNLEEATLFENKHTGRIYDLMMQFSDTGWFEIEVERLKLLMVLEKKYTAFNDFGRYVIKPAVDEINKKTSITVVAQPIRKGRTVYKIRFEFHRSEVIDAEVVDEGQQDLFTLPEGVSAIRQEALDLSNSASFKAELEAYSDTQIERALVAMRTYKNAKSRVAVFRKALKDGWAEPTPAQEKSKAKQKKKKADDSVKQWVEKAKVNFDKSCSQLVLERFEGLPKSDRIERLESMKTAKSYYVQGVAKSPLKSVYEQCLQNGTVHESIAHRVGAHCINDLLTKQEQDFEAHISAQEDAPEGALEFWKSKEKL